MSKAKDDIRAQIQSLIKTVEMNSGTNESGAIRDILTELMHICDAHDLDYRERFDGAEEVYEEERIEALNE